MAAAVPALAAPEIPKVRSRTFEIDYQVNDGALPLRGVQLWYTMDAGVTWHNFGLDPDGRSPILFTAPQEGLYGFFLVATNDAGASSEPPGSGRAPQRSAFVDYTPPVVQFHPVRPGAAPGPRVLHLKWTAIDANLGSRPIEIAYRELPDGRWETVARALPNTGRFDWRLDGDLHGRIMLRISVRDKGGNRSEAALGASDLDALFASQTAVGPAESPASKPVVNPGAPTEQARARGQRLYEQARGHLARGDHRLAVSRLRDALALDPTLAPALVDLGRALYSVGDYEDSISAYELALAQDSRLRSAFEGIAQSFAASKKYDEAAEHLRALLRIEPKDVQAWLRLGDVDMWRGDELSARDNYRKAATLDPDAHEVISQARLRLQNLDLVRSHVGPLVTRQGPDHP